MEEAQAIAAEYIQSLDNLPSEVQHLLAEIRDKENKIADIGSRIQPKMAAYLRHSTRAGGLTPKDALTPEKIAQDQARMAILADEKVACAERIVQLLTRARERLDVDLARALDRTGEAVSADIIMGGTTTGRSGTAIERLPDNLRSALGHGYGGVGGTQMQAQESLGVLGLTTTGVSTPGSQQKRRRTNSMAPLGSPAAVGEHTPTGRSRLSQAHTRQASPASRSRRATSELVKDIDGDGDEEMEDQSADPEDKTLYCTCQQYSYGKMIGCDNDNCPYQWFHLPCVGLKENSLPSHWYCPECTEKLGPVVTGLNNSSSGGGERRRKGRK